MLNCTDLECILHHHHYYAHLHHIHHLQNAQESGKHQQDQQKFIGLYVIENGANRQERGYRYEDIGRSSRP
ncbi:unnamed protein product, partial [Iphiclides podalirius]